MALGTDGNKWYISNDLCLGDPRAVFVFEDTVNEAITAWLKETGKDFSLRLPEIFEKHPELRTVSTREFRKEFPVETTPTAHQNEGR